jgi:hypothetical protein
MMCGARDPCVRRVHYIERNGVAFCGLARLLGERFLVGDAVGNMCDQPSNGSLEVYTQGG